MLLTKSMLSDLTRALRARRFEIDEASSGLYVPASRLMHHGAILHTLNGRDPRIDNNMVVKQGRIYDLVVALANGTQIASWYLAPFANNAAVQDTWDGANFTANAGEFTNYDESTRQQVVFPDPTTITDASLSNAASLATITVADGVGTTIWGAGIISTSAKSNTTGKLWAAVKFGAARSGLQDGDSIGFNYVLTATSP